MNALRNYLDKIKPNFEEGGKFHAFRSVFDGFETFLFVPNTTSKTGTHIHDAIDSKRIMSFVVIALIPALLFGLEFMKNPQVAEILTKLQKEWKNIGPVAKKHSDAVWKRFIGACDYFFERKNKATSSQRSEEVENLSKKEDIIKRMAALDVPVSAPDAKSCCN